MLHSTIENTDHRNKTHEIEVVLESVWNDEKREPTVVIKDDEIVYFSVYTVTRYCFSAAEGGCWDNWISHEFSIPFRFNKDALDMIIEVERDGLVEYAYGNIYHSTGGQECFVTVERRAGSQASTERAYYC